VISDAAKWVVGTCLTSFLIKTFENKYRPLEYRMHETHFLKSNSQRLPLKKKLSCVPFWTAILGIIRDENPRMHYNKLSGKTN